MSNKYFLGSVGTVEAFRFSQATGQRELAFRSKTLTDSGINISTTKDDIRAGQGAPIQFSFYHDPSVEINLTDVIFDKTYVEAQLGAEFKVGSENGPAYNSEPLTASDGTVSLSKVPQSVTSCGREEKLVWYSEKGANNWRAVPQANINGQTVSGLTDGQEYCFRYLALDNDAWIAKITSGIIPQELFLVITAPVFSGDSCSASNGKKAGTITYEIPRFKLNGAQDFAMNMSSNQTMSLAGSALAEENGCEIGNSLLLRVILKLDNEHWYTNARELMIDEDCLVVGKTPEVYALQDNGSVNKVDNDELNFPSANYNAETGKWKAGGQNIAVSAKDRPELSVTVTVVAE